MDPKRYILVSIIKGYGSVTHTSKDTVEECLKVGRRYVRNGRARPVAIVDRDGKICYPQGAIEAWAKRANNE